MFKNFDNNLNKLQDQDQTTDSVHNSLLHFLSNFQDVISPQNIA